MRKTLRSTFAAWDGFRPKINEGGAYTPPQWTDADRLLQELWPQGIPATICQYYFDIGNYVDPSSNLSVWRTNDHATSIQRQSVTQGNE
eukprot:10518411-Karenia_brevis.AAC.1